MAENWWIDYKDKGVRKSTKVHIGGDWCEYLDAPDTREGAEIIARLFLDKDPDADPIIYRHNP